MLWYRVIGITELIFIAAFVLFYILYLIRVSRIARSLGTPFNSVFIKLLLRTFFFALVLIALLGPSLGQSKKEIKNVGKDIMICVDLSKSMDAFDIQPTRLEKVKNEMKKIVNAFNSDRVGVIIFSGEAFMQCPLTYDQTLLNLLIETMNTSLVPPSGTDFAPPLRMAIKKFEEDKNSQATKRATSKVIILISDGEDFGENTESVARQIEDDEIKLFTLGVGTQEGGKIMAHNGFKTDKKGSIVVSKLNSNSLRSLADKTDGQYFEINQSRNDITRLINTISRIEGEVRNARFIDVSSNKYYWFLIPAFVLLLIDILVPLKTLTI